MMPIQAKADNNVPFTGARPRFSLLGLNPTWMVHQMAAGQTAAGERPRTASQSETQLDPVIGGGAHWNALTKGGLFYHLGKGGKGYIVEAMSVAGGTVTIVDEAGAVLRPTPAAPFRCGPGEFVKVVGGGAAARLAILVRLSADYLGVGGL